MREGEERWLTRQMRQRDDILPARGRKRSTRSPTQDREREEIKPIPPRQGREREMRDGVHKRKKEQREH